MRILALVFGLLIAAPALAQPPQVVNVYAGPGASVIYLDAPFDPDTDTLMHVLPVPWSEAPVRRLYTAPSEYNNQPDGEGSEEEAKAFKEVSLLPGGYAIVRTGAPSGAVFVERAGVRSQPYFWQRPRIYGVWGRTTYVGGQLRFWGHRVGGRDAFAGKGSVWLVDEAGIMHPCRMAGTWRETRNDATSLVSLHIPKHLPPGKYLLRTHANYGWQWGWSNDEPVELIERPLKTDVVKTVGPPANGAPASVPLNDAIHAAGPGGTIELLPGTYRLDQRVDLLPAQTLRGDGATLTGSTLFVADDCTVNGLHFTGAIKDRPIRFPGGAGSRVAIVECSFKRLRLDISGAVGWRVEECRFDRSGLHYGRETFIKGCKFSEVGWHHACTTVGARDSCISECTIDGADRGFVQFFSRGSVAGCFWYRNELANITQVPNGCEHFLTEGGSTRVEGLATHIEGSQYQLDKPITGAFISQTPYAVRHFDGHTTEAVRVLGFSADDAGELTRFTLSEPFRSQRADVPVKIVYGFFDNMIYKTRMRDGLGAAVNIFGTMAHNNRFENLVSFGPMYVKVFGNQADNPTTGLSLVDCELHGGRVSFSGPARYNVLDGIVVNDPLASGTNQFTFKVAERDLALPVLESKGIGNVILRAAVVRPGGMKVQDGFEVLEKVEVLTDQGSMAAKMYGD